MSALQNDVSHSYYLITSPFIAFLTYCVTKVLILTVLVNFYSFIVSFITV